MQKTLLDKELEKYSRMLADIRYFWEFYESSQDEESKDIHAFFLLGTN
jgi:hypothetical protein